MPASMISDAVGGRWNVIGISIAIVATGPMPGRTPISVPTMQPISAYSRFWKESATEKPSERLCSISISPNSIEDGDVHAQADLEYDDAEDRQDHGIGGHLPQLEFVAAQRGDDDQRDQGREHAGGLEQEREGHDADRHHGDGAPLRRLDRVDRYVGRRMHLAQYADQGGHQHDG